MSNELEKEKYIKENPMDYLKAIDLINQDPSNGEIMKVIYQVTRLHIPTQVFKYYSLTDDEELNEIKLKTLMDEKIYLADSTSFNDPFDNKAFFYRSKALMKYDSLKRWNGMFIDDFSNYNRLSSLTSVGVNSMPMWAHYSNNHKGYCVEYDTKHKENMDLSSALFPVQYTDKRIDITPIMDDFVRELETSKENAERKNIKEIPIDNLILIWIAIYYSCLKQSGWSYEKELRVVASPNSPGAPFIDAKPSTIYIGKYCTELNKMKLYNIAFALNIPIYQMSFDEYSFSYELIPVKID